MTSPSPLTSTCPDHEDLAAFVDERLSGDAHAAVVEHLATCEACYDVYAETLRVLKDLGPQAAVPETGAGTPELAPVIRHPRSFGWTWRTAAAVAAAAVLAFAVRIMWFGPPPAVFTVADLSTVAPDHEAFSGLASSPLLEDRDWHQHGWRVSRGANMRLSPGKVGALKRAFRLGVHTVDLHAALELNDLEQARIQVSRIQALIRQLEFYQPLLVYYQDVQEKLETAPADQLRALSSRAEDQLVEGEYADPLPFSFGKWTETARLATLAGNADFFRHDDFLRGLRQARRAELASEISEQVEKIAELVRADGGVDLNALKAALEEIIRLEGVG